MQLVRGSEVGDFLRCRKRWNYRWNEKLKAKRPDGKLWFGNLFHKFMQIYYECLNDPHVVRPAALVAHEAMQEMFQETDTHNMEQTELDDIWDLACKVTEHYVQMWGEKDSKIEVIATEITFAIPLSDDLCYTGTIDLIFKDKDGKLWFMDHKTTTAIDKYEKNAEMDRQISRYWWALQQLANGNGYVRDKTPGNGNDRWICVGEPLPEPHGFVYNIILKDFPEEPEPLKKGGLSKAKAQRTTYDVYMKALRKHGLVAVVECNGDVEIIPDEYNEILEHLKNQESENGNRFFKRITVNRTQAEVDAAIEEFKATVEDMGYVKPRASRLTYRNITSDCSWDCQYKALCLAEMDGSNAGMIRSLAYEKIEDEGIEL